MEIEILPPDGNDDEQFKKEFRSIQRADTLGCLILGLFLFCFLYVFLSLLPLILAIMGFCILFWAGYIVYKAYLEEYVLRLVDMLKSKLK